MRVFALFRPNTDQETRLNELNRELFRRSNNQIEIVSVDSREGSELAKVYDIMRFPAVVAVDLDGHVQSLWDDESLPLINDISYYLNQ
ncbi:hypothetical protein KC930_03235 [Candidatus Saccharibacteria bacterium]|nr:hypothetical protein [Candidatus Saccharibacteria bacterium]